MHSYAIKCTRCKQRLPHIHSYVACWGCPTARYTVRDLQHCWISHADRLGVKATTCRAKVLNFKAKAKDLIIVAMVGYLNSYKYEKLASSTNYRETIQWQISSDFTSSFFCFAFLFPCHCIHTIHTMSEFNLGQNRDWIIFFRDQGKGQGRHQLASRHLEAEAKATSSRIPYLVSPLFRHFV